MNNFLADGGDSFPGFRAGTNRVNQPGFDVDALAQYIGAQRRPVAPGPQDRITKRAEPDDTTSRREAGPSARPLVMCMARSYPVGGTKIRRAPGRTAKAMGVAPSGSPSPWTGSGPVLSIRIRRAVR